MEIRRGVGCSIAEMCVGRVLAGGSAPNGIQVCKEIEMLAFEYKNKDINLTLCFYFMFQLRGRYVVSAFTKWRSHWRKEETNGGVKGSR